MFLKNCIQYNILNLLALNSKKRVAINFNNFTFFSCIIFTCILEKLIVESTVFDQKCYVISRKNLEFILEMQWRAGERGLFRLHWDGPAKGMALGG